MKCKIGILIFFFACNFYAQVGINTTSPQALFEIKVVNETLPNSTDGILIPRINNFPTVNPGANQNGMLVYLAVMSGGHEPGFYYWNNASNSWNNISSSTSLIDADSDTGIELIEDVVNDSISFKANNLPVLAIKEGGIYTGFGGDNLFIGKNAGENAVNTGIKENIGIGRKAQYNLTTGAANTAIGRESMRDMTTGRSNVAYGNGSLKNNATGNYNTAIGVLSQTGGGNLSYNTSVGLQSLENVKGSLNVAIGDSAGGHSNPTKGTGSGNVFLGSNAGTANEGNGNVFIGFQTGATSAYYTVSEILLIDNGFGDPLIEGDFLNETLDLNADVTVRETLTVSNGLKINDGTLIKSMEVGNETIPSGVGIITKVINFSSTFITPPNLQVTIKSATSGEVYIANTKIVTTLLAVVEVYRLDVLGGTVSSDVEIDWVATEK